MSLYDFEPTRVLLLKRNAPNTLMWVEPFRLSLVGSDIKNLKPQAVADLKNIKSKKEINNRRSYIIRLWPS